MLITPMPEIINVVVVLFLLGFWTVIFLLLYHLIRFGIGTHPRRVAFLMLMGSIVLTALTIMLLYTVN